MIAKLAISWLRRLAMGRAVMPPPPANASSVALIELTGLGDVVAMLPAIQGMRSLFPSAALHLIVDENAAGLLKACDLPCVIHGIPRPHSLIGTMEAIRLARTLGPTLTCSMSPPRRNALVALASGAPCIAGYLRHTDSLTPFLMETPVEAFGLALERQISYGRENIGLRALKVCRALGMREDPPETLMAVAPRTVQAVRSRLLACGFPTGDYIVMHPFAGWTYRAWPLEAYADLAERLLRTGSAHVVFLWEREKEGDLPALRQGFAQNERIHFAPSLSLLESAVLMSSAELFIGNDSGPLHLAAALGTPVVGLFGPSDPALTAPRTSRPSSWMYKPIDCSPCNQRTCVRPTDSCLGKIGPEEVYSAALSVLHTGRVRGGGANA